jgi:tetratricopeptide (TPR) repeat protein
VIHFEIPGGAEMIFPAFSITLALTPQVGIVDFETSATPAAQAEFLRGVAILHSFGFEDAIDVFQKAQALEPDFALAYWGEAMAHNGKPLLSPTEQDLPAARNALSKLGRREVAGKHYQALRAMWSEGEKTRRFEEAERFLGETSP